MIKIFLLAFAIISLAVFLMALGAILQGYTSSGQLWRSWENPWDKMFVLQGEKMQKRRREDY